MDVPGTARWWLTTSGDHLGPDHPAANRVRAPSAAEREVSFDPRLSVRLACAEEQHQERWALPGKQIGMVSNEGCPAARASRSSINQAIKCAFRSDTIPVMGALENRFHKEPFHVQELFLSTEYHLESVTSLPPLPLSSPLSSRVPHFNKRVNPCPGRQALLPRFSQHGYLHPKEVGKSFAKHQCARTISLSHFYKSDLQQRQMFNLWLLCGQFGA
ncbi:hypothetical protein CDAR_496851 [Caerostris darwini]|uniref:Uncharacterized protein n=1 Tax=Caerostris darwini TaxID=1538125 RepID=A0AAV4U515_9ARAC|nr:hypothetical protein CDAR_496851 [Caerostris darwini]